VWVELGAGSLSAVCFAFSWRELARCRVITGRDLERELASGFEKELELRELNAELNLAKRNVKGLGQVAFTGGLCLAFWALTGGREHQPEATLAFALGGVGGVACLVVRHEVGSLADVWRLRINSAANRKRRRQGVDQPERTG
jgi:hypothetical protein